MQAGECVGPPQIWQPELVASSVMTLVSQTFDATDEFAAHVTAVAVHVTAVAAQRLWREPQNVHQCPVHAQLSDHVGRRESIPEERGHMVQAHWNSPFCVHRGFVE